ncbi:TerC family protein [Micavibrio aeruginosavorus]|uniref:Integral membrane TerC family protein n=1 Tax=Micavibrio aeruginosavorus (strain ARL-13) TaxID=856793 RepID=G2KS07_MICAA|nr:TerC family protein [Micavibrio aeruginosavorus]AEP10515.1 integral membrane TerC family protein [Micavibrio aeruginosavorus ARL-13]
MDLSLDFLNLMFLGKEAWLWLLFMGIVVTLLVVDLGILHKDNHVIGVKESLWMSAGYITIALIFGGWVWWEMGRESGMNYLTGFFVEKTLALDNIFVISLIFTYFAVPQIYQHRVLFWGILGVIVLRGIMIGFGTALVSEFSWILYVFGAFLILTGIKMMFSGDEKKDMGDSKIIKFLRRHMRVTDEIHGQKFFIKKEDPKTGRYVRYATPLFLALLMVEFVDIIFAVDSVPAIFAITTDPYIVYTSNIFAILGLRALYFALAAMMHRFVYLKYALSVVLIFIGGKIFWNQLVGKMDPGLSLGITLTILASGIIFSLLKTRKEMRVS